MKAEINDQLKGCNAVQLATPMFAFIEGAAALSDTCTISLGLPLDDYSQPQLDCLQIFMYKVSHFFNFYLAFFFNSYTADDKNLAFHLTHTSACDK